MRTRTLITGAAFLAATRWLPERHLATGAAEGLRHARRGDQGRHRGLRGRDRQHRVHRRRLGRRPVRHVRAAHSARGADVAPAQRRAVHRELAAAPRSASTASRSSPRTPRAATPSTCTDDIGGTAAPIALTGVPPQFIPCTRTRSAPAFGRDDLRHRRASSATSAARSAAARRPRAARPTARTRSTTAPPPARLTTGRTSSAQIYGGRTTRAARR